MFVWFYAGSILCSKEDLRIFNQIPFAKNLFLFNKKNPYYISNPESIFSDLIVWHTNFPLMELFFLRVRDTSHFPGMFDKFKRKENSKHVNII